MDCRRVSLSKDELARLRFSASAHACLTFCKRAPLDNLFSFYTHSLPGALKSLANLFFHYKTYPAFYTPPRTLLLCLDIAARTRRAGFLSRALSGPPQSTHPKTP